MNMREEAVYGQLYQIVKHNMEDSGEEMKFSQETFLASLGEHGDTADILRLQIRGSQAFLEGVYMQLLGRFPDASARNQWKGKNINGTNAQKTILRAVINSNEFCLRDTFLKNNIYEDLTAGKQGKVEKLKRTVIQMAKPIVRKLPRGVKRAIKHCMKMA